MTSRRAALIAGAITTCRQRRRASKVIDSTGAVLSGGDVLARAFVLRRLLRRGVLAPDERAVGVLLPPSAAAVATNLALTFDARTVVNLNYTLTSELLNGCIRQAGIRHVLTSRRFMDKLQLQIDAELVYLEDFRDAASPIDKAIGGAMAYALPVGGLVRLLGHHAGSDDDPMTVIFTSGTTGDPKGAVLTYGNIASNVEIIDLVIHTRPTDTLIGVLPFFHAFGYTVTFWCPLAFDIRAAYHVNPLDAQTVGRMSRAHGGTILLATPMFLRTYARRCEPEDFANLEIVVTGGEHLPRAVADEFDAKFGIRPVEGYGCTEMSPIVAANIPPKRAAPDQQDACRDGTVGRALPGIRVKTVDRDTGADLPTGGRGLLAATGPNVMAGYLGRPDATAKAVRNGWYVTGDVAEIDADGFVRIVGRESRFAKIGGEMVSHLAVEEPLIELTGYGEDGGPKLAVVSVPDPAKGERLVVVHTALGQTPAELRRALAERGLPNLYLPGESAFVEVEALPSVGTGKLDIRGVQRIALERMGAVAGAAST